MQKITAREIIALIAPSVPVEQHGLACMHGDGFYHLGRRTIYLVEPDATDGFHLAMAAHEAFHAARHQRGVAFYDLERRRLPRDIRREETAVNREAAAFLLPQLAGDRKTVREARRCFRVSRMSYSLAGQTLRFFRALVTFAIVLVESQTARLRRSTKDRQLIGAQTEPESARLPEWVMELRAELAATSGE
jgi:hypothetical protein